MQDGRFSTIRFNEWICVSAQYEKAVARLGRQVYQGFTQGYITDFGSLEICKEISDTFAEARLIRLELEEEQERDALDGLNVKEAKKADEIRKLTQAQRAHRQMKLKVTKLLGVHAINRSIAAHRDKVRDLSRDLGLRALNRYREEPVLKKRGHKALCRLAEQLGEDADKKWDEIVVLNKQSGGALSFHTLLINFVGNFASFSKGTAVGKFLLKFFKYDETQEKEKLSKQYEGSQSEAALRAQMEEVEEPHLNVGREIDTMQQEYEETPEEWLSAGSDRAEALEVAAKPPAPVEPVPAVAEVERWEPEEDAWNPDSAADDDFLDAVTASSPELTPPEPAQASSSSGPTLLRKRPEPEAESWLSEAQEESTPPSVNLALPTVGSRPSPPAETPKPVMKAEEDWGWGATEPDPWDPPDPQEETPNLAPSLQASLPDRPDSTESSFPTLGTQSEARGVLSQPVGKRPPFLKTPEEVVPEVQAEESYIFEGNDPGSDRPGSASAPDLSQDKDLFTPPESESFEIPLPPQVDDESPALDLIAQQAPVEKSEESDPLLPLLRQDRDQEQSDAFSDDLNLGDDLLPDFLKDRNEDEQEIEEGNFIPELPSFLANDDGPQLEILPFGSSTTEKKPEPRSDEDLDLPFIPDMPD